MIDNHDDRTASDSAVEDRQAIEKPPAVILGRRMRQVLAKHGIDPEAARRAAWDDGVRCPPLVVEQCCDIAPVETPWLWPWRIPHRRLTILASRPRDVARHVAFDIVARVSRGTCWPDQVSEAIGDDAEESAASTTGSQPEIVPAVGNVLVISASGDLAETVVPELTRAGADMQRVFCLSGIFQRGMHREAPSTREMRLPEDIRSLRRAICEMAPLRLIVIDRIEAVLHSSTIGWGPRIAEANVSVLRDVARDCDVSILGVAELRGTGGRGGMGLELRHPALAMGAQTALGIARVPGQSERYLMTPIKTTVGSQAPPLELTKAERGIEWCAVPAIVSGEDATTAAAEGLALAAAMTWLRNLLSPGPIPALEVVDQAHEAGLSRTLLRRVKMEIGVKSEKAGRRGKSYWSLPDANVKVEHEKVRAFQVDPAPLNNSREISKARGDETAPRVYKKVRAFRLVRWQEPDRQENEKPYRQGRRGLGAAFCRYQTRKEPLMTRINADVGVRALACALAGS